MHWTREAGKRIVTALTVLVILFSSVGLMAWSEHPLITHAVMASLPEVSGAEPVPAESIEAFLTAEGERLAKLLVEEEIWARSHLEWYPPLPDALKFKADGGPRDIRERFCRAIRINPRVRFPLYLQMASREEATGRPSLRPGDISFLKDTSDWTESSFFTVTAGERVRPLEVLVSATDEPDLLGLDIGLFEDNGTEFGNIYGFGLQPFGNPNLEYSSQAPFHMGFYHESRIFYLFAGFLKKTLPEYRIDLYKRLARFAFETGHPYWGWRFMGLGLHYLADLAQPYHATVFPGMSDARALWINTIDVIGIHGPKSDAVQLVSNRHTALDKFVQVILQQAYRKGDEQHPVLASLASSPDGLPYGDDTARGVVARLANAKANETDLVLEESMPLKFVLDPTFELGTSPEREQIVEKVEQEKGREAMDRLTFLARDLLLPFATYGRGYVREILGGGR